jgi:hypothetical protein
MKMIKVRFKANISGHQAGEIAEVDDDFVRRAGSDVEVLGNQKKEIKRKDVKQKDVKQKDLKQKDLKVSNKSMNKEQINTKSAKPKQKVK